MKRRTLLQSIGAFLGFGWLEKSTSVTTITETPQGRWYFAIAYIKPEDIRNGKINDIENTLNEAMDRLATIGHDNAFSLGDMIKYEDLILDKDHLAYLQNIVQEQVKKVKVKTGLSWSIKYPLGDNRIFAQFGLRVEDGVSKEFIWNYGHKDYLVNYKRR